MIPPFSGVVFPFAGFLFAECQPSGGSPERKPAPAILRNSFEQKI
jgi:hypothetical protein